MTVATPTALYEAGLRHLREGRFRDARSCCEQVISQDPGHAAALHLMGLLSLQEERPDQAIEWISNAIRLDPKPEYLVSLASVLRSQGRHDEALRTVDKAVQLKPADSALWMHLGDALLEAKRPADALMSFQHASKLKPDDFDAAYKTGALLLDSRRYQEALDAFKLCDRIRPNHAPTLRALALSFRGLSRLEDALTHNLRAHALDPQHAATLSNIGDAVAQSPGGEDEAISWFDEALKVDPNLVPALNNKAHLLYKLQRFEEFMAISDRVKALEPDNAVNATAAGQFDLLTGNFEAGWIGLDARLKHPSSAYPKLPQPMWLGNEPLEGKTILVGTDEGMGDTIQFVRYVPMLAARGARVILVVQDPLHRLMSGLSGVSQCLSTSGSVTLSQFDLHCAMCSLPRAFGTRLDTIPAEIPYLPAPASDGVQAWEERLGTHTRPRVGLVWSGNPKHVNDHNRSVSLRMLARIVDSSEATFVSLQKDPRPDDRAILEGLSGRIIDQTAYLTDFSDTAALIKCLDLVISVDTSVAHLAGALGCPTWILLPYTPDWRWLLNRDDSPWYPTVRLFRQDRNRNWGPVVERVRAELNALF